MARRYEVFLAEITTRTAIIVVEVGDKEYSDTAERIAKERVAEAKWSEPNTELRFTGTYVPRRRA